MKIAWVTPLAHTSAIGRYSRTVLAELTALHEVEAFTFGDSDLADVCVPVHVFQDAASAAEALTNYDVAVYQVGNDWRFHGEIVLTARLVPGLVVLHDCTIQHLMAHYCFEHLREPDVYIRLMKEFHGTAAADAATSACSGARAPIWETDDAIAYPLTPFVTQSALGVITHSDYARARLGADYGGPVAVLPLPYTPFEHSALLEESIDIPLDALVVITTGHLNPNKRVKEALLAIGRLPDYLKSRVVYALLGPVADSYAAELKAVAAAAGLYEQVRIEGYVTDAKLSAYIKRADLCVNLRFPNYEGASASLIEQLFAGRAVIASSTGSFAEFPPDVIQHLNAESELPEVLEQLLTSKQLREELGAKGANFALRTFHPRFYARDFSHFATNVVREEPTFTLQHTLCKRASHLALANDDAWLASLIDRLHEVFLPGVEELQELSGPNKVTAGGNPLSASM